MNASTLRSALQTKFAASFICIEPPSQTKDKFEIFISNLELNVDSFSSCNPFLTIMISDFNEKFKQWSELD